MFTFYKNKIEFPYGNLFLNYESLDILSILIKSTLTCLAMPIL